MKKIWVVFIKEFLDIVRDRRRLILTLISIFIAMPFDVCVASQVGPANSRSAICR